MEIEMETEVELIRLTRVMAIKEKILKEKEKILKKELEIMLMSKKEPPYKCRQSLSQEEKEMLQEMAERKRKREVKYQIEKIEQVRIEIIGKREALKEIWCRQRERQEMKRLKIEEETEKALKEIDRRQRILLEIKERERRKQTLEVEQQRSIARNLVNASNEVIELEETCSIKLCSFI